MAKAEEIEDTREKPAIFKKSLQSASTQQVIERYDQHSAIRRLGQSTVDLQIECDENKMDKVVEERTRELRQLNGEELEECTLEELQKLEERLQRGLSRVSKTKDERFLKPINALKRKGIQLMEENRRLKQKLAHEQGQSSESIVICSSSDNPPQDSNSSDTSLRLGLSLFK